MQVIRMQGKEKLMVESIESLISLMSLIMATFILVGLLQGYTDSPLTEERRRVCDRE